MVGIDDGRIVNRIVESGAKLVEHLPEKQRKVARDGRFSWNAPERACSIVIDVEHSSMEFRFAKRFPGFAKGEAVSFCSFDSIPRVLEWNE
jgi:hypothetical protein